MHPDRHTTIEPHKIDYMEDKMGEVEPKKNEWKLLKSLMRFLGTIVVEIMATVIGLVCCLGIYFIDGACRL